MPIVPKLNWTSHKSRWSNCKQCELCKTRSNVVLARGDIPCDVIFIGEAPGPSEDTIGSPFMGAAGKLLDQIIENAEYSSYTVKKSFTNLISCTPVGIQPGVFVNPDELYLKSCKPRLQEFVELAKPKGIVMAGKLVQKWAPILINWDFEFSLDIMHPAQLLRLDASQQPLAIQRTIVNLKDMFTAVKEFCND
jgi:uracil-DNA glycosylase family 4